MEDINIETGSFTTNLKKYDETKQYNDYGEQTVSFTPTFEIADVNDIRKIMDEINKLSSKLYYYGFLCDHQTRVLQQLEDEFERWKAERYKEAGVDDKQFKSEKSKERHVYTIWTKDFTLFQQNIGSEGYKLSLLQRVVRSLEAYGYKLHDLKDYNLTIGRNS